MASRLWVSGLLLACALVSLVQAEGDVVVLTPDNFDDKVGGSQSALIEFYAPWCGHCKKLAPEWELLGTAFKKVPSVLIGKVDCDDHKDLCGKFGVSGFPTIKYFPKKSQTPEDYSGGRTADDLITFVNDKAGTKAKVKKELSHVTVLDKSNFEKVVMDPTKNVLVEFYAPWCGHCKSLAPVYEQLAKVYAGEPNVVVANLDADNAANKDIASKYGVTGFPTLMWFSAADKEPVKYESGRDLGSFVAHINEKAGTHRTESGGLTDEAGIIESLADTVKDFLSAGADKRQEVYDKAVKVVGALAGTQVPYGQTYLKVMKSILEKGSEYVTKESGRVERLLQALNPLSLQSMWGGLKYFRGQDKGSQSATVRFSSPKMSHQVPPTKYYAVKPNRTASQFTEFPSNVYVDYASAQAAASGKSNCQSQSFSTLEAAWDWANDIVESPLQGIPMPHHETAANIGSYRNCIKPR